MAVHLPLSHDAILEASVLMLGSHNIMSPANGGPIAVPSQDMVLGIYYLTKIANDQRGEGKTFASPEEVIIAYDQGKIDLHAKINVRIERGIGDKKTIDVIKTTTGRVIFNQILPQEIPYNNQTFGKKELRSLISEVFNVAGTRQSCRIPGQYEKPGIRNSYAWWLVVQPR